MLPIQNRVDSRRTSTSEELPSHKNVLIRLKRIKIIYASATIFLPKTTAGLLVSQPVHGLYFRTVY